MLMAEFLFWGVWRQGGGRDTEGSVICSNSLPAGRDHACARCILFWHGLQMIGHENGVNFGTSHLRELSIPFGMRDS
jgi:hypothetical protein